MSDLATSLDPVNAVAESTSTETPETLEVLDTSEPQEEAPAHHRMPVYG